MTKTNQEQDRALLQDISRRVMLEKGLLPDFSPEVITELNSITVPATGTPESTRDLRNLSWCSIDNDDSRDSDQLSVAIELPEKLTKILVAIADVDAVVKKQSEIDLHAQHNTTSVYTAAQIFPMLPEKLSTDLTSLNFEADRLAIVVEMIIAEDGSLQGSDIYSATVRNHAKLAYNSVANWLEGKGQIPQEISKVLDLDQNIRLQFLIAQKLKLQRQKNGALNLDIIKAKPVFDGDKIKELEIEKSNSSKDLIEDFMIAANGITARYLASKRFPSIRRVVRTPKRWDRIVKIASEWKYILPMVPDPKELDKFLIFAGKADPLRFPDLSLSVVKLLGSGEYIVELPGETSTGHFGLAVKDYAHSTAPNRRYPDLITHRLLKAAMSGSQVPYSNDELVALATHCTDTEDVARKVERQVSKSADAILMQTKIGNEFEAIVTGASDKGSWVRLMDPPIEGKLINPSKSTDVGDKIQVKLVSTDIEHGFIDFKEL